VAGINELDKNDVPHTFAFLRKLIAHFAEPMEGERRSRLKVVNIWSDGGQGHFKCAEAFAFMAHLQREVFELCGARVQWNYMQSYHGKGPYDAEGGLIKYHIRRQIFLCGVVFRFGKEVWAWCRKSEALCRGSARAAGMGVGSMFEVRKRTFLHVSKEDVEPWTYCSSPWFVSEARGSAALPTKKGMFTLIVDKNPAVRALACRPAGLGLALTAGEQSLTTPFVPSTLNSLVPFTGRWRKLSCACRHCAFGGDRDSTCSSNGVGVVAPTWEKFVVRRYLSLLLVDCSFCICRRPAALRTEKSFLMKFVDGLLASSNHHTVALANQIGAFIKIQFRRFQSQGQAAQFVLGRSAALLRRRHNP
jgi:hypothetical protein